MAAAPACSPPTALIEEGGRLADLSAATIAKLECRAAADLEPWQSDRLIGDADAARYARAVDVMLQDRDSDALLVAYCPTSIGSAADAAQGLVGALAKQTADKKNVFACWMGDASVGEGRAALAAAKVPDFETPERAVRAFMYLVRNRQNHELLLETPTSVPPTAASDGAGAHDLIAQALADGRGVAGRGGSRPFPRLLRNSIRPHRGRRRAGGGGKICGGHQGAGGAENPLARHHAQVRRRRRGAQSRDAG